MTDYRIGVELEVPFAPEEKAGAITFGESGTREMPIDIAPQIGGDATYERIGGGVRSWECRTGDGGVPVDDIADWYHDLYSLIQDQSGRVIEATGLCEYTTAGLHVHLSPLEESEARELARLSEQPWMQAFACTSVADFAHDGSEVNEYPVLRSLAPGKEGETYCELSFNENYNSVVKANRTSNFRSYEATDGHYEWRLPEPMTPDHFDVLAGFLREWLTGDRNAAVRDAKARVESQDNSLTGFARAEASVGIDNPTCESEATAYLT